MAPDPDPPGPAGRRGAGRRRARLARGPRRRGGGRRGPHAPRGRLRGAGVRRGLPALQLPARVPADEEPDAGAPRRRPLRLPPQAQARRKLSATRHRPARDAPSEAEEEGRRRHGGDPPRARGGTRARAEHVLSRRGPACAQQARVRGGPQAAAAGAREGAAVVGRQPDRAAARGQHGDLAVSRHRARDARRGAGLPDAAGAVRGRARRDVLPHRRRRADVGRRRRDRAVPRDRDLPGDPRRGRGLRRGARRGPVARPLAADAHRDRAVGLRDGPRPSATGSAT